MRPPAPSTSNVTPIRSGATSWTLRAKKSRVSMGLGVVANERREGEREERAAGDARHASGHDREAEARRRRERAGLQVPQRRGRRDLHELDPGHASAQLVGSDPERHHRTENRAHLMAENRQTAQEPAEPALVS